MQAQVIDARNTDIVAIDVDTINVQNISGQLLVSSREIAKNFEKQHKHVIEAIEEVKKGLAEKSADLFIESKYQHTQNKQWYKEYLLTRDGFTLLAMGFTGSKALGWKMKYIDAFNSMEKRLKGKPTCIEDVLIKSLEEMKDLKQQVNQATHHALKANKEVEVLKDKMTVNYELAENLRSAINYRAVELLGGKGTEAYKRLNKKLFSTFYKDIRRAFKVNSYKNISVKNYDLAIRYIEKWNPKDEILTYAIDGLNNRILS